MRVCYMSEPVTPDSITRRVLRLLLVAFYAAAGWLHLRSPDAFLLIVPPWVPEPRATVLLTGIAELAGAAGLLWPRTRRAAGWGLAAYALCVWPANLHHALAGIAVPGLPTSWWYHGPRLAAQPLIIAWALYAGGIIPGRARRG